MSLILTTALLAFTLPSLAQSPQTQQPAAQQPTTTTTTTTTTSTEAAQDPDPSSQPDQQQTPAPSKDRPTENDRIFGVLPNYTTVRNSDQVPPLGTGPMFRLAALGSFDPYVVPFLAGVTGLSQLERKEPSWKFGKEGYAKRYAAAFADNTIGNFLTTAVMPSTLKQDPRYYELGTGSFRHRFAYAASRSLVTRSRSSGQPQFNVSELGGNFIAAGLSNLYHPADDRTVTGTLMRWGMQVMWDTLSNEMKEFWPDIHNYLRHH